MPYWFRSTTQQLINETISYFSFSFSFVFVVFVVTFPTLLLLHPLVVLRRRPFVSPFFFSFGITTTDTSSSSLPLHCASPSLPSSHIVHLLLLRMHISGWLAIGTLVGGATYDAHHSRPCVRVCLSVCLSPPCRMVADGAQTVRLSVTTAVTVTVASQGWCTRDGPPVGVRHRRRWCNGRRVSGVAVFISSSSSSLA